MKIEVWTDFVCPFCYIGKRQLELALNQLPFKQHVIIEYKSFEIYPASEKSGTKPISDLLLDRYKLSNEQLEEIILLAEEVNLSYKLDVLMHVDTFNAHRFMKYACTQNRAADVVERLLKAYFINNEQLDDYETIMKICDELSFDKDETSSILKSNKYSRAVQFDQIEASEIGIEQIPFFIFNEEQAIAGIQSIEVFREALEMMWEHMGRKPIFSAEKQAQAKTTYCTGDKCDQ